MPERADGRNFSTNGDSPAENGDFPEKLTFSQKKLLVEEAREMGLLVTADDLFEKGRHGVPRGALLVLVKCF